MSVVTIDDNVASSSKATRPAALVTTLVALFVKELKHAFQQGEPVGIIQSQLAAKANTAIVYECDSWIGWTRKNL